MVWLLLLLWVLLVVWVWGLKCLRSVAVAVGCVFRLFLGGLGLLASWLGVRLFIIYWLVAWYGFVLGVWVRRLLWFGAGWWFRVCLGLVLVWLLVVCDRFWIWCFGSLGYLCWSVQMSSCFSILVRVEFWLYVGC